MEVEWRHQATPQLVALSPWWPLPATTRYFAAKLLLNSHRSLIKISSNSFYQSAAVSNLYPVKQMQSQSSFCKSTMLLLCSIGVCFYATRHEALYYCSEQRGNLCDSDNNKSNKLLQAEDHKLSADSGIHHITCSVWNWPLWARMKCCSLSELYLIVPVVWYSLQKYLLSDKKVKQFLGQFCFSLLLVLHCR